MKNVKSLVVSLRLAGDGRQSQNRIGKRFGPNRSVVKRNGLPTIEDVEAKLEENLDFEDSIAVDSHKEA